MSISDKKGKKHLPETRAKISAGNKGKVMSEEARAKMSRAQKDKNSAARLRKQKEE